MRAKTRCHFQRARGLTQTVGIMTDWPLGISQCSEGSCLLPSPLPFFLTLQRGHSEAVNKIRLKGFEKVKGERAMKVSALTSLSVDERELHMKLLLTLTTLVLDLVLMQAQAFVSSPQLKANARSTTI